MLVSSSAGRGRASALERQVLAVLRDAGLTPNVLPATTAREAERQAADDVRRGTGALVAVGGDGTVHAAVQAVAGTTTPLAVVPAGHVAGAVTYEPFEQPTVSGPNPPGAGAEV